MDTKLVRVMAFVEVGVNSQGDLAMRVCARESARQTGILEQFNRAAAAFALEFGKEEEVKLSVLKGDREAGETVREAIAQLPKSQTFMEVSE